MPGSKPAEEEWSEEGRPALEKVAARHATEQQKAQRARIILKAAEGKIHAPIAAELRIWVDMATVWRPRWLDLQPIAREDVPRPGAPSHFIVDNLNPHPSESLVRYVADESDFSLDLGDKGQSGMLAPIEPRAAFLLSDLTHRLVFHATPKHASWMNQVDIWFRILSRKLLKRGTFISFADLQAKVLALIAYFNRTMAQPVLWTYPGQALAA